MVSEAPLLSKKGYEYKATKMLTVSYENGLVDRQRIVRIREGVGVHLALQLGRCKSPFQYWGVCHVHSGACLVICRTELDACDFRDMLIWLRIDWRMPLDGCMQAIYTDPVKDTLYVLLREQACERIEWGNELGIPLEQRCLSGKH